MVRNPIKLEKTKAQIRKENEEAYKKRFGKEKPKGLDNFEPTLTQQEYAEDMSLKRVVEKYHRTGYLPHKAGAYFGDLTGLDDFQLVQTRIQNANDKFMELPSPVRAEFDNNPAKLLDSLKDSSQHTRLRDLGVLAPLKAENSNGGTAPENSQPATEQSEGGSE